MIDRTTGPAVVRWPEPAPQDPPLADGEKSIVVDFNHVVNAGMVKLNDFRIWIYVDSDSKAAERTDEKTQEPEKQADSDLAILVVNDETGEVLASFALAAPCLGYFYSSDGVWKYSVYERNLLLKQTNPDG